MREILFRGKRLNNGELVDGYYIPDGNKAYIGQSFGMQLCEVDPTTIGQYTGLTDKNGKRIFDGDVVESRASDNPEDWKRWIVDFEDGCFCFKRKGGNRKLRLFWEELCEDNVEFYGLVVICNIHDNPKLLKEDT